MSLSNYFSIYMFSIIIIMAFNMGYFLNYFILMEMLYVILMNYMIMIKFNFSHWMTLFWMLSILLISACLALFSIVWTIRTMKLDKISYFYY